jgi:FkbH-like protein
MTPVEHQEDKVSSVRIAANFTIEPIEEFLAYWFGQIGLTAEIRFAPYNQVFQQLLEGGLLRSNRGGINLVALDLDAWLVEGEFEPARAQFDRTIDDLMGVLRSSGAQGAGGAVILFPPVEQPSPHRAKAVAEARSRILSAAVTIAGWSALDLTDAVNLYAVTESRDPFTDELGNIPFTEDMYVVAATAVARWIRCLRRKAPKVVVLDCDNTLWQGVCGEGPVQVTPPYRKLHQFMMRQRDEGVLLAIASKNNEADVMAVLESEDCLLKPEHFTAWQINWQPKSENLKTLADELGLALNSFLFVDDSRLEAMEVGNACPEVLTATLPENPESIPAFLEHYWAFDHTPATKEDRERADMYEVEKQRAELSRKALTHDEFLASLQIEIHVAKASESELPRVAQLTQRTTQFNMTGVLHTVQSLTAKIGQRGIECWTVRVRDIFGDYGLVGAIVFETVDDSLKIDTFLLSCRALGRGVEDRMVQDLRRWALERGAEQVVIPFLPTPRNRPALQFLAGMCEVPAVPTGPFECVLSASDVGAGWRPADVDGASAQPVAASQKAGVATNDESELLIQIANRLQTVDAVLAAMRTQMKRRPTDAGPYVVPQQGVEELLARIWSECLAVEPIGAQDNFFDFGGQSLIATRILARVRSEFGVEMGLSSLFERPTVAEMAAHITSAMMGGESATGLAPAKIH